MRNSNFDLTRIGISITGECHLGIGWSLGSWASGPQDIGSSPITNTIRFY